MGIMKINKELLPMKAHFFLFNAGQAPVVPFIPTLARELGFSSVTVGTIYTFLPIMGMLAKPLAGGVADRYMCRRSIFLSLILGVVAFFIVIPWIPKVDSGSGPTGELHCDGDSYFKICSQSLGICYIDKVTSITTNVTCKMKCDANSSFVESICNSWGETKFCSLAPHSPRNHLLEVAKLKSGLPGPHHNGSRMVTKALRQIVEFEAILKTDKTERIGECGFIRVDRVKFSDNELKVPYCDGLRVAKCSFECDNGIIAEPLTDSMGIDQNNILGLYQFWLFVFCLVLAWVSMAVVVSLGDSICFELLGDFPSKYGNQRLWGSVGWGLLSIIAGLIVDGYSGGQSVKDYRPSFILMAVILIIDLIISSTIKAKQTRTSPSILKDIGKLLSEFKIVVFMIWCVAVGMCTALIWNFLFWYLEDLASARGCDSTTWIKTLEGLAMGVQCFGGELPFFFLSGGILRKIGHVNSMTLVLFTLGVRFLLYSSLTDPWWCLPIELLNGLTFGLFYSTMASYASIISPPGTESTTQGIVGAVFEGVGVSLGSFLGGVFFNKYGGASTFRYFGYGAIIFAALHSGIQFLIERKSRNNEYNPKDFKSRPSYRSPNESIRMLNDNTNQSNSFQ